MSRPINDVAVAAAPVAVTSLNSADAADPVPVPELSTETSTTVRNENGTYTAEVSSGPVNYQDDAGDWVPISNDLVPAPGDVYSVENEANDYTVSIPQNPAVTPVRFELDDDWVTMKLVGSAPVDAIVAGDEATFDDLTPSADEVSYQATDSGVKETITLDTPPTTAVSFAYSLRTSPGVTPVLTDTGMVEFRDDSGEAAFVMPAASMTDSRTPEAAFSDDVSYALAPSGSAWSLRVTPKYEWLSDPARVYPVRIDPTVDKITQKDCFLQQEAPGTTHCGEAMMKVGATNNLQLRRAIFDFNINGIPAGATVQNATAWMYMDAASTAGSGGATSYALYNPGSIWGACASWAYNCAGGTWVGGSPGGQISSNVQSMGGTTSGWQWWDVTGRVAGWLNGTYENRGVLLRQTGENVKKVLSFYSSTSAVSPSWNARPLLRVTYVDNLAPNTPSNIQASPGTARSAYSTTPTLSAWVSDPDSASLNVGFTILRNGNEIWSQTVPASSGSYASVTVPAGVLVDRKLFRVRVVANDGYANGIVKTDLFVAATGPDETSVDSEDGATDEETNADSRGYQNPFADQVEAFTYNPDGSTTVYNPPLDRPANYDSACPGDGVEDDDRYDHITEYYRYDATPTMVGTNAILYCGMSEDYYPEHAFGLRHIRAEHKSQYALYGSWEGWSWQTMMDFMNRNILDEPDRVSTYSNGNRYCYERKFGFRSINGSTTDRMAVVILGKTGRRIMSSWPRDSSNSYCLGHGQVIYSNL